MKHLKKHIRFVVAAAFAVCVLFTSTSSRADLNYKPIQTTPFDLTLTAVGVVDKILKPDAIRLQNGKVYKIDNIRVPPPFNDAAVQFLEETILNKKVGFYIVGEDPMARSDRFGHTLAHIVTEDGSWVQAQMVSRGLAWAVGSPKSRDLVLPLFKYEDLARSEALGLWADPNLAIRDNDTIDLQTYNSFQIYQGKVTTYKVIDSFLFLNFGSNPQTDFTMTFNDRAFKSFRLVTKGQQFLLTHLVGKTIRVRGWVEENGGPMMTIEYPEQLEFPDIPDAVIMF